MLERNKLFEGWENSFITTNLDFMIDEGKDKTYIRFMTGDSEYKIPDSLKDSLGQLGEKMISYDGGKQIPPVLEEVEQQINDFICSHIKRVKDNPNKNNFNNKLTDTLIDYKKLKQEWIISTGSDNNIDNIITYYEVVPNH